MLTHEDAFYHKLLLETGVPGELEPVIDRLLNEEEPLSDVALRLAYCHGDTNEQLAALNEFLSGVPFESMDTNAVFEKLKAYFRKAYEADPDDLKRLSGLMYRISNRTGHEHEEPWFQLWMVGEYYDCVEDLSMNIDDFRERLEAFLYRGKKVYPWEADQAREKHGKKPGILIKLKGLLFGKRNKRMNDSHSVICPVCGKTVFREVCDYDICPVCGWENGDSVEADPPFNLGLAEYKKRYGKYLELYPDYTWEKFGCPEITEEEECRLAHRFSQSNEADIHSSGKCGCFFCFKVFDSGEVNDWLNDGDGKTALCPYCGVDSVLPDSKVELSKEFLEKMYEVWFGAAK